MKGKQERKVGGIVYQFTPKKVKNINLRVSLNGEVSVSAPPKVPLSMVDLFVQEREGWVQNAQQKMLQKNKQLINRQNQQVEDAVCLQKFQEKVNSLLPLVAHYQPGTPEIKVKEMKTRWGVCYPAKNRIVLNKQLYFMPEELLEYVVLHELVHFKYPNHQKEFHDEMKKQMPDYKERRKKLRGSKL